MGACGYETIGWGKTLQDAYRHACEQAATENGHQHGYSGDIQTSCGVTELRLPKGMSTSKAITALYARQRADWDEQTAQSARADAHRWPDYAGQAMKLAREAERSRARELKKVPEAYQSMFARAAVAIENKCGPALAIELKGKALQDAKAAHPELPRGTRGWIFIGTAAC